MHSCILFCLNCMLRKIIRPQFVYIYMLGVLKAYRLHAQMCILTHRFAHTHTNTHSCAQTYVYIYIYRGTHAHVYTLFSTYGTMAQTCGSD